MMIQITSLSHSYESQIITTLPTHYYESYIKMAITFNAHDTQLPKFVNLKNR